MTFEGLLPFILLLIMWGASQILLKMAKTKQKGQAAADQKPGFFKILQQQLADLEEESNDEELEEYSQPPFQPPAEEYEMESLAKKEENSLQQESFISGRETVAVSLPIRVTKPRSVILRKKPLTMMNRRKLQNAVIWAEILAPPVALRNQ
jgi:hypothetical protein